MATDREIAERIGKNIREARELEELSINEVAKRKRMSAGFWNRVERGIVLPTIPMLVWMAQALNWDFRDLLQGIDDG